MNLFIRRMRLLPYLISVLIGMQAGLGVSQVLGASEPSIPGYYGSDISNLVPPSVHALPVVREVVRNASVDQVSESELIVHQTDDKAVIDWESFDIGADAQTRFDQQGNAAWSVLNRIHDENPSQIFGSLTADGKVYLINPNGIIFAEGSTINVNGMIASSLDVDVDEFLTNSGALTYTEDIEQTSADTSDGETIDFDDLEKTRDNALIANHGSIDSTGSVSLISTHVANTGSITLSSGQLSLLAGDKITGNSVKSYDSDDIDEDDYDDFHELVYYSRHVVLNDDGGQLVNERGGVNLEGSSVNQKGLVRTVSSIKYPGEINMKASDLIITGESSRTQALVSSSEEKVSTSFKYIDGSINLSSDGTINHEGTITCPSGNVSLNANDRVYLAGTSSIDVKGVEASVDAEDSLVTVKLNSVELRDEYAQKDGVLQGEDVTFVGYDGSSIGVVNDYVESKESQTAAEWAVDGGSITITSKTSDVIVRDEALLDFSGGSTYHEKGFADITWLVSGNRAYSISDAPSLITYDSVLGSYEKTYERYGITESLTGVYCGGANQIKVRVDDYYTGANAGSLTLNAETVVVLDGDIDGSVYPAFFMVQSPYDDKERLSAFLYDDPQGGKLFVGEGGGARNPVYGGYDDNHVPLTQIVVTKDKQLLPEGFTAETEVVDDTGSFLEDYGYLSSDYYTEESANIQYKTIIDDDTLSNSGLSWIELKAAANVTINKGATVSLEVGTNTIFNAEARTVDVFGTIEAPSGEVELTSSSNETTNMYELNTDGSQNTNSPNEWYISSDAEDLGPDRIYISGTGRISTAGETVDTSLAIQSWESVAASSYINGGAITLTDNSYTGEGVILRSGSVLNVDGGYEILEDGSIDAGDAGEIYIDGYNVVLDGTLLARSLYGAAGGTIELASKEIEVIANEEENKKIRSLEEYDEQFNQWSSLPDDLTGGLKLYDDRLEETGASHIILKSLTDLTLGEGVLLEPSKVKLASPIGVATTEHAITLDWKSDWESLRGSTIELYSAAKGPLGNFYHKDLDFIENSLNGKLIGYAGSSVRTGPEGAIVVEGPGIELSGTLKAPAGTISLSSGSNTSTTIEEDLILYDGSVLSVAGCILPNGDALIDSMPESYTPLDGGTISIESNTLQISDGAKIDVSAYAIGEELTHITQILQGDNGEYYTQLIASNPGSVSLTFQNCVDENGDNFSNGNFYENTFRVDKNDTVGGLTGGALALVKSVGDIEVSKDSLEAYLNWGFDALALKSDNGSLNFTGSIDRSVTLPTDEQGNEAPLFRTLTLDAENLAASGEENQSVTLAANQLTLKNSNASTGITSLEEAAASPMESTAVLNLESKGFIEINGALSVSGFGTVGLTSAKDIIGSNSPYSFGNFGNIYFGGLYVPNDLELTAARIYPATYSDFTFSSGNTIQTYRIAAPDAGSVYSAGGRIVLESPEINHGGVLLAPMGEIVLCAEEIPEYKKDNDTNLWELNYDREPAKSITLEEGSVLSVAGDTAVLYGNYSDDFTMNWVYDDVDGHESLYKETDFEGLDPRQILISGDTVESRDGTVLDVSGGGSVFTYLWREALEGSVDPLDSDSVYVIIPAESGTLPGDKIYFPGSDLIEEGYYAVLPKDEGFAFQEGAIIVEDLGVAMSFAANRTTDEGYAMVTGYSSVDGQEGHSPVAHDYVVRDARDVRAEGNYSKVSMAQNDAGILQINADTNIIAAELLGMSAGNDALGGSLTLTGTNVFIGPFESGDDDLESLAGTLWVDPRSLSGSGFTDLNLGDEDSESLTVLENSIFSVENLNLVAQNVTLKSGSSIDTGQDEITGSISITAASTHGEDADGSLLIEENASIQAGEELSLSASHLDIQGTVQVENGTLMLEADSVAMGTQEQPTGLWVDGDLWDMISNSQTLAFVSRTGITLEKGTEWEMGQNLILDTSYIRVNSGIGVDNKNTLMKADRYLTLKNNGTKSQTEDPVVGDDDAVLTLTGTQGVNVDFAPPQEDGDAGISRDLFMTGIGTTLINTDGTIKASGKGDLTASDGDLELSSSMIRGSFSIDEDAGIYTTPDVGFLAEEGGLLISSSGTGGNAVTLGGAMTFLAQTIDVGGTIALPSGGVTLEATGAGGITLQEDSVIDVSVPDDEDIVSDYQSIQAGIIRLTATEGGIDAQEGSTLNLSGKDEGMAGTLYLSAGGNVTLDDESVIAGGSGGSLYLESYSLGDVDSWLSGFASAGMDESVLLRVLTGDMTLSEDVAVHDLILATDGGSITVTEGIEIDASGEEGGFIGLYAAADVVLESGSILDASGKSGDGGDVVLSSTNEQIQFNDGAEINVAGADDYDGGTVIFSASRVDTNADDLDDSIAVSLEGLIKGPSSVVVEGREIYEYDTIDSSVEDSLVGETAAFLSSLANSLNDENRVDILDRLSVNDSNDNVIDVSEVCYVTPGIEIQNSDDPEDPEDTADITLTEEWNLDDFWYAIISDDAYTDTSDVLAPGSLTLRAAGDLKLNQSLISMPTILQNQGIDGMDTRDSWDINLVAGSNLESSTLDGFNTFDHLDGKLEVSNGAMVYSESGNIHFASKGDTILGSGSNLQYNSVVRMNVSLATFEGNITGQTGGNLEISGSAIQANTGDITLNVDEDLRLLSRNSVMGSVRTLGMAPVLDDPEGQYTFDDENGKYYWGGDGVKYYIDYDASDGISGAYIIEDGVKYYFDTTNRFYFTWLYSGGGDIRIHTGGDIESRRISSLPWDYSREEYLYEYDDEIENFVERTSKVFWSANYGFEYDEVDDSDGITAGIVALGEGSVDLSAVGSVTCPAGTFGMGDLTVRAGGDLDGRFLVYDGLGTLFTAGSFGLLSNEPDQTLELGDSGISLYAQGMINIGDIIDPSAVNYVSATANEWDPIFTSDTRASLETLYGDIVYTGTSGPLNAIDLGEATPDYVYGMNLPAFLRMDSGQDIILKDDLLLSPSETGNLELVAGGSILGDVQVTKSGGDVDGTYAYHDETTDVDTGETIRAEGVGAAIIDAGEDIVDLKISIDGQAVVSAGNDLVDIVYSGTHYYDSDVTLLKAGGEIIFGSTANLYNPNVNSAVAMDGPGTLIVWAGELVDLLTSSGLVTGSDSALSGSDIVVISGYDTSFTMDKTLTTKLDEFFNDLREEGKDYTDALGDVDEEEKTALNNALGNATTILEEHIGKGYVTRWNEDSMSASYPSRAAYREEVKSSGDIDMMTSQITTKSGGDIYIITAGDLNLGESVLSTESGADVSTGIVTQYTGGINIFTAWDVNVNQSRLMTWLGGEITIWADSGDINAGLGSRSEVSTASSGEEKEDPSTGIIYTVQIPSVSGSGIQALTYDPDGSGGNLTAPEAGNVYLFAPGGVIDAGEAGIAGSLVYLGSKTVLNVQNISFSQGAVGVPMAPKNTVDLGAIAGGGAVSAATQVSNTAEALAAVNKDFGESADKMGETFLPTWLRVEFMGFDVDDRGI